MISVADIRMSMRITNTYLDQDIRRNMDACQLDLERVGICVPKDHDALIDKAIELYCKAQCDFEGKMETYQASYERLRDAMSLAEKYRIHPEGNDEE